MRCVQLKCHPGTFSNSILADMKTKLGSMGRFPCLFHIQQRIKCSQFRECIGGTQESRQPTKSADGNKIMVIAARGTPRKAAVEMTGATCASTKNELIRQGGIAQSQWVLGTCPCARLSRRLVWGRAVQWRTMARPLGLERLNQACCEIDTFPSSPLCRNGLMLDVE